MLGERSKRCITMNQKQIFPFLANRLALLLGRMLAVVLLCSTVSCYHQSQQSPDAWNLTDDQLDSISFYTTHHYAQNFNFVVVGDSLHSHQINPLAQVVKPQNNQRLADGGNAVSHAEINGVYQTEQTLAHSGVAGDDLHDVADFRLLGAYQLHYLHEIHG